MTAGIEKDVLVHPLSLADYLHERTYAMDDQLMDPRNFIPDIDEALSLC